MSYTELLNAAVAIELRALRSAERDARRAEAEAGGLDEFATAVVEELESAAAEKRDIACDIPRLRAYMENRDRDIYFDIPGLRADTGDRAEQARTQIHLRESAKRVSEIAASIKGCGANLLLARRSFRRIEQRLERAAIKRAWAAADRAAAAQDLDGEGADYAARAERQESDAAALVAGIAPAYLDELDIAIDHIQTWLRSAVHTAGSEIGWCDRAREALEIATGVIKWIEWTEGATP